MIPGRGEYGKSWITRWFIPLVIVLLGSIGFAIGRLSATTKTEPVTIFPAVQENSVSAGILSTKQGSDPFVASRNGKRYYPINCASAARIKDINRIYFASESQASAAGYTQAANCTF